MASRLAIIGFISAFLFGDTRTQAQATTAGIDPIDLHLQKVVLDNKCEDPMGLVVAQDGRVIFVERNGLVKIWKPETRQTVVAAKLEVNYHLSGTKHATWEDGLVGIALDPHFDRNHWVYLFNSPTNVDENHVSRFVLNGDHLDMESEKIILRIAMQRDVCCHTGGSLAFDSQENLYISTGDNTNPFESDGYAPIDHRPGRSGWDAARSSGNTDDLRGKILRIHPEADGAYSIPKGNLFSLGVARTRPEIFVMGCRNPFRISIDLATDTLYWGEVGPDANLANSDRGPAGFDEFNRTRVAGNFGWPFVIGDNKPYRAYDFSQKTSGSLFDPQSPQNLSPNNTGLHRLPPAQAAWIWYPYSPSTHFPTLGSGPRAACAGPVYHFDKGLSSPHKLPREYDNVLFLYDWARGWIRAVKFDSQGSIASILPFASQMKFKHPIEMELGPDGCLYMIEFGTAWERGNDAQLIRLEYHDEVQNSESQATR